MVKHIVMWKLNDRSDAHKIKAALDALPPVIPQIREFEVGIGDAAGTVLADLCLMSAFDTEEDLKTYAEHPEHQKVVALIRDRVSERRVIDYTV